MRGPTRNARALALVLVLVLVLTGALAPSAYAHGLAGREDLPLKGWQFAWAGAIVLAASFAALGSLWREPRLEGATGRRLVRVPAAVDVLCGAAGFAFLAIAVYAGLAGVQSPPQANLVPTVVYVILWVGVPVASVLFGDVFRLFNPWRSLALAMRFVAGGRGWRTRPYPERLGRWPAAAGILVFAWIELALVQTAKDDPSTIAWLIVAYTLAQLAGMALFGIDAWSERADPFCVYFSLYASLSAFERRERVLHLRPPLSGTARWTALSGSVALLAVAIGSTTFDGFSSGPTWASLKGDLSDLFGGGTAGGELAATVGLLVAIALVAGFYRLGVNGMKNIGRGRHDAHELSARFVHSLVPIAFAYALAHYFSLLVFNGQAMKYLISDPLGHGSDIFGTAGQGIDYFIGSSTIAYVQVAALVTGHVAGLILAHDRALEIYSDARDAARSQYWMLVVMVGFTSLGLWLLFQAGQG